MAQYGGGLPTFTNQLPPARIQPQPVVPVPREFITLAQPRSDTNRKQNEYIDTPLRPQPSLKARLKEKRRDLSIIVEDAPDQGLPGVHRSFIRNSIRSATNARFDSQLPVSVQPTTFKKNKYDENVAPSPEEESIICRQCGKCKCGACRSTRQMPERWICNNECLCSVQNVVDYCTCFCCVKALFYHWAKDREVDTNTPCADNPCSCGPQHRCLRWGCMGIMSMLLPCLCFYWPLTGCVKLCEMSYAKVMSRGCRCTQRRTTDPPERAPEKRLLDSNSDC